MNNDDVMKKIQGLKDLRHAIDLIRNSELEKAQDPKIMAEVKQNGQQAVQAVDPALRGKIRHMGIDTTKNRDVISHKVGIPGTNIPHHYEIDVNMNHLNSKIPAYTVHKIHSASGKTIESAPTPHKDISSAVSSLMNHAYKGSWE